MIAKMLIALFIIVIVSVLGLLVVWMLEISRED